MNHFVTPILNPRTIEPMVRDGECAVAVVGVVVVGAYVGAKDFSPLQRITMIPCT